MTHKIIKLFLRLAIAIGFLSAVADRLGIGQKKFRLGEIGTVSLNIQHLLIHGSRVV